MVSDNLPYIPCLRWKQGEYFALRKLSTEAREDLLPLIEIAELGYDFETGKELKSLSAHLKPFAKRVSTYWGQAECLIDLVNVGTASSLSPGCSALKYVFDDLRAFGIAAVPVVRLGETSSVRTIISKIISRDRFGLALRISIEEAAMPGIEISISKLIGDCGALMDQCDLIVDLRSPNYDYINDFVTVLENIMKALPFLEHLRRIALLGTSFPSTMASVKSGCSIIPRNEWKLYKLLATRLKRLTMRIPSFSDYVIHYPEVLDIDPRLVKPNATVRYTIVDGWIIAKGKNVRDYGYGQYRDLCRLVVDAKEYTGPKFSAGDKYIYDCSRGTEKSGNLTTWRWVGTNRHLEFVAREVAALHVS